MCFYHEVFKWLRVDFHLSVSPQREFFLTFFEFLSGIPVVLSHSVALLLHYHATGASDIPVHQVPAYYGLKIRPFARPFLDKSTESSLFNSSSDLRIFKLDGVPCGRDIPNNLGSSSLSSSEFDNCCSVCSKHRNMPSLPSYGTGSYPMIPFSDFIRYGIVFGHCSHIVQTSS